MDNNIDGNGKVKSGVHKRLNRKENENDNEINNEKLKGKRKWQQIAESHAVGSSPPKKDQSSDDKGKNEKTEEIGEVETENKSEKEKENEKKEESEIMEEQTTENDNEFEQVNQNENGKEGSNVKLKGKRKWKNIANKHAVDSSPRTKDQSTGDKGKNEKTEKIGECETENKNEKENENEEKGESEAMGEQTSGNDKEFEHEKDNQNENGNEDSNEKLKEERKWQNIAKSHAVGSSPTEKAQSASDKGKNEKTDEVGEVETENKSEKGKGNEKKEESETVKGHTTENDKKIEQDNQNENGKEDSNEKLKGKMKWTDIAKCHSWAQPRKDRSHIANNLSASSSGVDEFTRGDNTGSGSILAENTSASGIADELSSFNEFVHKEISLCYDSFNNSGSGYLALHEIQSAYSSFNIDVDIEDCRAIIDAFDTYGYGHIKFTDFYREMYETFYNGTTTDVLENVFKMMDEDGDGYIGIHEITKQFQKLGALITPEEALQAVEEVDKFGYGLIDFYQFKIYCLGIDKFKKMRNKADVLNISRT